MLKPGFFHKRLPVGQNQFFGQPSVKWFTLRYQTVVRLSVLSVTFVYCGQTVGRIKMKLGMQVGLGPGHIVLDGDPAPLPQRGAAPIFGPYLLRPNSCRDQDATWYEGRTRPRRLCFGWGPHSLSQKGGRAPKFSANGYCGQMAGWIKIVVSMEVGLSPGNFMLDGNPTHPLQKLGEAPPPRQFFRPISIVAKWLDASRWHLAWR